MPKDQLYSTTVSNPDAKSPHGHCLSYQPPIQDGSERIEDMITLHCPLTTQRYAKSKWPQPFREIFDLVDYDSALKCWHYAMNNMSR